MKKTIKVKERLKEIYKKEINFDVSGFKLISEGAEAKIWLDAQKGIIYKERIRKEYRIKEIDETLRIKRTKNEVKVILKSKNIANVPEVFWFSDEIIAMEFIKGEKLKEILNKENYIELMKNLGKIIAKLHANNIIHYDLTTSNMILKDNKIYLIDFGLSFISQRIEDKGVDLHLLKEGLNSKHFDLEDAFDYFLTGYKEYERYNEVMERLNLIEQRGRYKHK